MKKIKKRRAPYGSRPKEVREWQRKRTKDWRERFTSMGLVYYKKDGHWGWGKPRRTRARIHSSDPREIERVRRKIMEARKK